MGSLVSKILGLLGMIAGSSTLDASCVTLYLTNGRLAPDLPSTSFSCAYAGSCGFFAAAVTEDSGLGLDFGLVSLAALLSIVSAIVRTLMPTFGLTPLASFSLALLMSLFTGWGFG